MDPLKRVELSPELVQALAGKSLWRHAKGNTWEFYCPLCTSSRKIPFRSRPGGARQMFQMLVATAFFTLMTWPWFTWKGVVVIVPLWAAFEVIYRTQVRAAVSCPYCGFDPFLYMIDVKRARQQVEDHWRKRFADKGIPFPEKNRPAKPAAVPGEAAEGGAEVQGSGDSAEIESAVQ